VLFLLPDVFLRALNIRFVVVSRRFIVCVTVAVVVASGH